MKKNLFFNGLLIIITSFVSQVFADSPSIEYRQAEFGYFQQTLKDVELGDDLSGTSFNLMFSLAEDTYAWVGQRTFSVDFTESGIGQTRAKEEYRFGAMRVIHFNEFDLFAGFGVFRQLDKTNGIRFSNQGNEVLVGARTLLTSWNLQAELSFGHREALSSAIYTRASVALPLGQRFSLLAAIESDDSNPGAMLGLSLNY
ncbi:hypothetical protein [Pelagibaculum spongiae]|nr:hypothetical protein [Pelagibaculum spongiae]